MEDNNQYPPSQNTEDFSVMPSSGLIPAKLPKRNFLAIAGGGNDTEYQCVQFVELLEYSKPQNSNQAIASACEASNANALANCTGPQYANQYFCPKTTVKNKGFEKSDILVWTNGGAGHTAICTDVNPDGSCLVWESNRDENGMISSIKVNNKYPDFGNTTLAGVWRYFPTKEEAKRQGCQ